MKLLVWKNLVEGLTLKSQENLNFCEGCVFGKQHNFQPQELQGLASCKVWCIFMFGD
jgi:hypothetical protein